MSWAALLAAAEAIRADAAIREPPLASLRIVAIGWATVDAERAFDELGSLLGVDAGGSSWMAQERDAQLGASTWRREPAPADGVDLVVLEPDTEGRLAAFLARFGEGVGAVYLEGGAGVAGVADRIWPVHRRWGPFAIVLAGS